MDFVCEQYAHCEELNEYLKEQFPQLVFWPGKSTHDFQNHNPFSDYNSPFAAKSLLGILRYWTQLSEEPNNYVHLSTSGQPRTVYFFLNCHTDSILDAISKPIKQGYFEVSFYQNILDNLGIHDEVSLDVL